MEYYLIEEDGMYGITAKENGGLAETRHNISRNKESTHKLILNLAAHTVMPVSLNDVVDDYLTELELGVG